MVLDCCGNLAFKIIHVFYGGPSAHINEDKAASSLLVQITTHMEIIHHKYSLYSTTT